MQFARALPFFFLHFAPGNMVILISDFGIPISLFALLISTNAI
jgi:hypothetical protein